MQQNYKWISLRAEGLGQRACLLPAFLPLLLVLLFEQSCWWGSSGNCYLGVVSDLSGANCKMAWSREKVWDHITDKDTLENALYAPHQPFNVSQVPFWAAAVAQIGHSGSLQEKCGCSGWIPLTYLCFSYFQGSLDSCSSSIHTFSHRESKY